MQGVTIVPGEVCHSSPLSSLSPSSGASARPISDSNTLETKSSFFSGKAVLVHDVAASGRSGSNLNAPGRGTAFQVRATATPKESAWQKIFGGNSKSTNDQTIAYKGIATIAKKRGSISNLVRFDLVDALAAGEDDAAELLGQKIKIQLVSNDLDAKTESPKVSAASTVEGWITSSNNLDPVADEGYYEIDFQVPKDFGTPGAFIVQNNHPYEFYLKSLALQTPDNSTIEFATNAWVYNHTKYPKDRVFFSNKVYLASDTPPGLKALREQELEQIRGDGKGERQMWDRIYDYDVYNDLGAPDQKKDLARPVLGGTKEFPYPRRIRTGRPMTKSDPKTESRVTDPLKLPYIPSDEYFLRTKDSTFVAGFIKGFVHSVIPGIKSALDRDANFESQKDIDALYKNGLPVDLQDAVASSALTPDQGTEPGNLVYLSTLFAAKGEDTSILNYPLPQVVKVDDKSWEKDEEFGRESLAGIHASVIACLQAYPPTSSLDPKVYGQGTALTEEHILPYLEGLTVAQAIEEKKLFIVDYHDAFLPYINRVNADKEKGFQAYATRSIFFHASSGQLKGVAIELSLPPPQAGGSASNRVFTPADAKDHLWDLAKAHASATDFNFHEVISHFTYCHSVMEPFLIAANRQLSEMHPIKTLLKPYFKDTLAINAAARDALINADGIVEDNFSLGQYTFQVASKAYGALWRFDGQALPQSLLSRGMAEPADASQPGSVKLVLDDYPWAKDGLDLWDAMNKWVAKYVEITYKGSDEAVTKDTELQAWWNEVVNVGHGDLKDSPGWPKLDSTKNLVQIVSTIAWIAGPTHAALNFGQYAYAGYPANKPSATRRLVPEKGSSDYTELQNNPEKFFLSSICSSQQATQVMSIIELLSTHSPDEEYVGTRNSTDWTSDPEVEAAFREFSDRIAAVEDKVNERNKDATLVNRVGPVKVPYTIFMPSSTSGLTGRGVPNSVSI